MDKNLLMQSLKYHKREKMNKKILTVIIMLVLLVVGLCGCNEEIHHTHNSLTTYLDGGG